MSGLWQRDRQCVWWGRPKGENKCKERRKKYGKYRVGNRVSLVRIKVKVPSQSSVFVLLVSVVSNPMLFHTGWESSGIIRRRDGEKCQPLLTGN